MCTLSPLIMNSEYIHSRRDNTVQSRGPCSCFETVEFQHVAGGKIASRVSLGNVVALRGISGFLPPRIRASLASAAA